MWMKWFIIFSLQAKENIKSTKREKVKKADLTSQLSQTQADQGDCFCLAESYTEEPFHETTPSINNEPTQPSLHK